MGKRYKNKKKPDDDFYVRGAKKNHPVDIELDVPIVYFVSETKLKDKSTGITSLGFIVKKAWMDTEGNIVAFVEPEKRMLAKKYDRYGMPVKE